VKIYWHGESKNVIGPRIRQLRQAAGLTQLQLAEKLQLAGFEFDRLTVGRIETGGRFVPDYEVKALADALGAGVDRLFENSGT